MKRYTIGLMACLLVGLATPALRAGPVELRTVRSAAAVVTFLCTTSPRDIPPELIREAAAVAVVPQVLKGGLLIGGRFGRGVVLAHRPDGNWDDPVFITLSGGSVGGLAGIETTDLVVVFRTRAALERVLQGRFELGGNAAVALGPLAGEVEGKVAGDWPRAEVLCYPRSRGGLFVGVSLEGAWLRTDGPSSQAFYPARGLPEKTALEVLKRDLIRLTVPLPPRIVPTVPPPRR